MNSKIVLKSRPQGEPQLSNFEERTEPKPKLVKGSLTYQTLFLSVDPYLRGRMNEGRSYVPPFELGQPIVSGFVGKVLESDISDYRPGDLVTGLGPWSRF